MIVGQSVTLYERTQGGTDAFNKPVYTEEAVSVANVLICEPSTEDITSATELQGKRLAFILCIPKGDTHNWKDARVEWTDPQGGTVRVKTFGYPMAGVEANVPGPGHVKVRCEAIE